MRKANTGGVPSPGMCRNAPCIWQIDVNCDMLIHFTKTFYSCRHQTVLEERPHMIKCFFSEAVWLGVEVENAIEGAD